MSPSRLNPFAPSRFAATSDLFERLSDCAFILDEKSHVVLEANSVCEQVLGLSKGKMIGRSLLQLIEGSAKNDFCHMLRIAMRRGETRHFVVKWRLPDGRGLTMEIHASPLTLSQGQRATQIIARDISHRKEGGAAIHELFRMADHRKSSEGLNQSPARVSARRSASVSRAATAGRKKKAGISR